MIALLTLAAMAAEPSAWLTWKAATSTLRVHAPAGEHIALDAPVDVYITIGGRTVAVSAMGSEVTDGVPVGDVRGKHVDAELRLSLCEDGGTRCRMVELAVTGDVPGDRRGSLGLMNVEAPAITKPLFPAREDASTIWTRAMEQAAASERPILLDFGAIWCPPCNLMSAELLDADPRPAVVDAFVIAKVDVDDPSSWDLKDRYAVGGYPTLVAVDAEGRELGRKVGYRNLDDTVGWLDAVATGNILRPGEGLAAKESAILAWQAVTAERDDEARRLLESAVTEPDVVEFRLARFHLDPGAEDARWLADRAPGRAIEWVPAGLRVEDPDIRAAMDQAITNDLATSSPLDAADLLAVRAEYAPELEARALYGAAAALVRTELGQDKVRDRGLYGWLAYLTEHAGNPAVAIELLASAREAWPDEPTYHVSQARLFLRQEMYAEALEAADRAVETSWGDNRITAASVKAEALLGLGRHEDARLFVLEILTDLPVPDEAVDVRTHRMRRKLEDLVASEP